MFFFFFWGRVGWVKIICSPPPPFILNLEKVSIFLMTLVVTRFDCPKISYGLYGRTINNVMFYDHFLTQVVQYDHFPTPPFGLLIVFFYPFYLFLLLLSILYLVFCYPSLSLSLSLSFFLYSLIYLCPFSLSLYS